MPSLIKLSIDDEKTLVARIKKDDQKTVREIFKKNKPKEDLLAVAVQNNMIWLNFPRQFLTIKNRNHVQETKRQLFICQPFPGH